MKKGLFVMLMSMFLGLLTMALIGCAVYPSPSSGCKNDEIIATKAMAARALMLQMEQREPVNWHCAPGSGYAQGLSIAAAAASAASASASAAAAASATAMSTVRQTSVLPPSVSAGEPYGDIYVERSGNEIILGIKETLFYRKPSPDENVYAVGDETKWQLGYKASLTSAGYWETTFPAKPGNHQVNMVIKRPGQMIEKGDPDINWAAVENSNTWMPEQNYKSAIRINVGTDGSISSW